MEQGLELCVHGSRIWREMWVTDSAEFLDRKGASKRLFCWCRSLGPSTLRSQGSIYRSYATVRGGCILARPSGQGGIVCCIGYGWR
jgi:hypothetical protein